jgi:ABC-type multidrug transport system fused ATPase/permease subunit
VILLLHAFMIHCATAVRRIMTAIFFRIARIPAKSTTPFSMIKKVMNYIRRYWGYLGMSIVLAAVTVALTLYLPVLTGRAVDLIIEKGVVDFAGILAILKKMAVIILLTAVAQWIMNACNNKITYNIIRCIRNF